MDGDRGLNMRFDGYSNEELAGQVEGLRGGVGPETLHTAVSAMVNLADGLAETDRTLREQLRQIGVNWEGEAAAGGTDATENASIYADDAAKPVHESAKGVDSQGASFTSTRNSAPDAGVLRGPTEESLGDQVAGLFGHTTDHASDVAATNAARNQAIDGLNNYQNSSSSALNNAQSLPVPPGMDITAQPVEQQIGTTNVQSAAPAGGLAPAGSGGGGAPTAAAPVPGGGGGGVSGLQPLAGGGGFNGPGPTTGVGPLSQAGGLPTVAGAGGLRVPGNPFAVAEAAAVMGAGGASGAGAGIEGDRTVRGGGAAGRTPVKGGTPLGAAPEEEARAARNAERFGARTGRPGSSIMQPAAAGGRGSGEDDKDHVRRFGIDSDDVFEDERVVAPESIGDEEDRP